MMNENNLDTMLTNGMVNFDTAKKIIEKLQYVMDFGEITVQYDFCLN